MDRVRADAASLTAQNGLEYELLELDDSVRTPLRVSHRRSGSKLE